jgi:predicted dehydrogenase
MNNKNLKTDYIKYSNKKILTVGIIGAGDVVAKAHLPQLLALEQVSVSWVTDIDSQRAKRVAKNYKVKWLPIPSQLEDLPYTDIVLLAIPYGVREPYFKVLRERKSAIYLEKPVARSVGEHKQLTALFQPSKFAVGFQRRSLGTVSLLKKMVIEEMFGRLNKVRFRHGGSANVFSGKAFSTNAQLAGGGVLIEHGIHGLDLALFISDAKSANSYRVKTVIEKGFDVHAEGHITLENSLGDYEFDFKVSWLTEIEEGLTFFFENAILYMTLEKPEILLKTLSGKTLLSITDAKTLYPTTGMQTGGEFWRNFLMGIKSEKKNYTSMESCLLTTEIIEKILVKGAEQ